jgi:hypothetical protein
VTFDEDEAFRRSRESQKDEDREEQEAPRDVIMVDSTPEKPIPEEKNEMVESERLLDPPREAAVTRRDQLGSGTLCRKLKDMQRPKDLLERTRDHTSFPAMWC